MKAIVQNRYGGAAALTFQDVPRPGYGAEEVLVQVVAAGVDRGALHLMTGRPYLMRLGTGLRAPKATVPGVSFAGRVAAIGARVTDLAVGDEVYGAARGTFAEFVAAAPGKIAPTPAQLSFEEAAVLPYAAFAALQAVREHSHVKPGERVLVVGASGAVGSIAVQVAKAFGAEVTGVCGPRDQQLLTTLGADSVIDYTREDFTSAGGVHDVVLDVFGRTPLRRLRRALTPRGRLVIVGGEGDRWVGGIQRQLGAMLLSPFVHQSLRAFVAKETAETLQQMNDLIADGKVHPVLGRTYPLVEAADAVAALEAGTLAGRIVLTV